MDAVRQEIMPIHDRAVDLFQSGRLGQQSSGRRVEKYLSRLLDDIGCDWAQPVFSKWTDRGAQPRDHFFEMFSVNRGETPTERWEQANAVFEEYENFHFEARDDVLANTAEFGQYYEGACGASLFCEGVIDATLCAGLGIASLDVEERREVFPLKELYTVGETDRVLKQTLFEAYPREEVISGEFVDDFIDKMYRRRTELIHLSAGYNDMSEIGDVVTITGVDESLFDDPPRGDGRGQVELRTVETWEWLGFGWPYYRGEVVDAGGLTVDEGDVIPVTGKMRTGT